jgi:SdrD B-like domain
LLHLPFDDFERLADLVPGMAVVFFRKVGKRRSDHRRPLPGPAGRRDWELGLEWLEVRELLTAASSIQGASADDSSDSQQPASLSGFVFAKPTADSPDFNPSSPDGEAGLVGAAVILYDSSGTILQIVSTDTSGAYHFTNLSQGNYSIGLGNSNDPAELTAIAPDGNGTVGIGIIHGISAEAGSDGEGFDFPELVQPATISGYVFLESATGTSGLDLNNPAPGQTLPAGFEVSLFNSYAQQVEQVPVAANGFYTFTNLEPAGGTSPIASSATSNANDPNAPHGTAGAYGVVVDPPTGYISDTALPGSPNNGQAGRGSISLLSVNSGQQSTGNDLPVLRQLGDLSGFVFSEPTAGSADFNSRKPAGGEAKVVGATVTLTDSDGNIVGTPKITNSSGAYDFKNLQPGIYSVTVTAPTGFTSDKAWVGTQGDGSAGVGSVSDITIVYGSTAQQNNFPVFATPPSTSVSPAVNNGALDFTVSALQTGNLTVTGQYAAPPTYHTLMPLQQPFVPTFDAQFSSPAGPVAAGVDSLLSGTLGSGGDLQSGGAGPQLSLDQGDGALDRAFTLFGDTRTEQWSADEPILSLLEKLADVDEMSLVSFEFGDDVVSPINRNIKRVTAAKPISSNESAEVLTPVTRGSSTTPASVRPKTKAPKNNPPNGGSLNPSAEQRETTTSDGTSSQPDGSETSRKEEQQPWMASVGWTVVAGAASSFVYRQRARRRRGRMYGR